MSFAEHILNFLFSLDQKLPLPDNVRVMNPFKDDSFVRELVILFYRKFYDDNYQRKIIIGINPGRLGAGTTGIPFTDTKRMQDICGIDVAGLHTHEPSSVFVYKLIEQQDGPIDFYQRFYVTSVSPLGFLHRNNAGKWVNCNYYDYKQLEASVMPFIERALTAQAEFPINREICFVLGKKNADHFIPINKRLKIFKEIKVLEHPRYIMQYKAKEVDRYLDNFVSVLTKN